MKNRFYICTGDGPECGQAIAMHDLIDKVAFTGSVEVCTSNRLFLFDGLLFNMNSSFHLN